MKLHHWIGAATLVFASFSGPALAQSAFCAGYQTGYQRGACNGQYACVPPVPPVCPVPNAGQDSYQDGYDRGFQDGQYSR